MNKIILKRMPMPPVDSRLWLRVWNNKVPSPEFKIFKRESYLFYQTNKNQIDEFILASDRLKVSLHFKLKKSRLITKENNVKRWDVQNRLQAIVNMIMAFWGIDDSHIFEFHVTKSGDLLENESEYVDVELELLQPTSNEFCLRMFKSANKEFDRLPAYIKAKGEKL